MDKQRDKFIEAMIEAGYDEHDFKISQHLGGGFLYEKAADMFVAWQAASQESSPVANELPNEQMRERVMVAVAEALGEALDCTRVWSAWGHGSMRESDFVHVADDAGRLAEIADAAIAAMSQQGDSNA